MPYELITKGQFIHEVDSNNYSCTVWVIRLSQELRDDYWAAKRYFTPEDCDSQAEFQKRCRDQQAKMDDFETKIFSLFGYDTTDKGQKWSGVVSQNVSEIFTVVVFEKE